MRVRASSGRLPRRVAWITTLALACVLTLALAGCLGPSPSAEGPDPGGEAGYALVKPGKLTVVSDLANPPFDYYDSENVPAGFEVELMQAVAQKMGLECEYLPAQKFDSIIPMIKQGGRADVGASNFTITDERLKEIDFTDAYIDSNQGIVTSSDIAQAVASDYDSNRCGMSKRHTAPMRHCSRIRRWTSSMSPHPTRITMTSPSVQSNSASPVSWRKRSWQTVPRRKRS